MSDDSEITDGPRRTNSLVGTNEAQAKRHRFRMRSKTDVPSVGSSPLSSSTTPTNMLESTSPMKSHTIRDKASTASPRSSRSQSPSTSDSSERALSRRMASRTLIFDVPEEPLEPEPESTEAWLFPNPYLSSGSTTLELPSNKDGETENLTETESTTQSKHETMKPFKPVLRRARPFQHLPPLFQEAWGALEEMEEHEANTVDAKANKAKTKLALRRKARKTNLLANTTILRSMIPATYTGPRLLEEEGAPVTMEFVLQLINSVKSGVLLHYSYAHHIFSSIGHYMEKYESTVMDIVVPHPGTLVVVGDLHGQLDDLLTVFKIQGFPSETNYYLFNGDLVDRGEFSLEILLIVYSLKLVFPKCVFINRGNHENRLMNARFNFEMQVKQKYDAAMFDEIQNTFNWLPIAAVIENSVFIVHGGLTQYEDFTIDELRKISRRDILPHALVDSREDRILEQLLWSDPARGGKGWIDSRRGAGILFSAAITRSFIRRNGLQLIVRSHQLSDKGYSRCHDGKLITIFSASNYCGHNNNLGAIAVFDSISGKLQFVQYEADTNLLAYAPNLSKNNIDPKIVVANQQRDSTLEKLHERILKKRHALFLAFGHLDRKTGFVSLDDWANVMTMVVRIDLHWQALWPFLGYVHNNGDNPDFVNYTRFLDLYTTVVDPKIAKVVAKQQNFLVEKLCRKFYERALDLRQVFEAMDKDKDGKITYDEFCGELRKYKKELGIKGGQLYDLMRSVSKDSKGLVRFQDFLDRFALSFDKVSEIPEKDKEFLLEALGSIASAIWRKRGATDAIKMKRMFRALTSHHTSSSLSPSSSPSRHGFSSNNGGKSSKSDDFYYSDSDSPLTAPISSRRGSTSSTDTAKTTPAESLKYATLNFAEFDTALRKEIKLKYTPDQMKTLFDYFDRNRDGHINYFEFRRCFKFSDAHSEAWASNAMALEIHHNRQRLLRLFVEMDIEGSGKVALDDFKAVFNSLLGHALEEEEARVLGDSTSDSSGDNVDYNKFLKSFKAGRVAEKSS